MEDGEEVDYSESESGVNTPLLPPRFECAESSAAAGVDGVDNQLLTEINLFMSRIPASESMPELDIKATASALLEQPAAWMVAFRKQLMAVILNETQVKRLMSFMYIINRILVLRPAAGAKQQKQYREGPAGDQPTQCAEADDDGDAPSWLDIISEVCPAAASFSIGLPKQH